MEDPPRSFCSGARNADAEHPGLGDKGRDSRRWGDARHVVQPAPGLHGARAWCSGGRAGEQPPRGTLTLGFWTAVCTAVTYLTFDVGLLLDPVTPSPWDVWVPIGASALIAPSFLLLAVSLHYAAPPAARLWTHSSMLFATVYTALAELVYVTWLFVVEPRVIDGTAAEVGLLRFEQGSFVQMVDAAAYTFMGIAAMLTAPAFTGWSGRWPRWLAVANGPAAVLAFVSYVTYELAFGAPAGLLMPAYAVSVALWFRRRAARPAGQPAVPRSSGKSSAR